ncbi:MAG: NADH-quinone oxidoreductase subunit J [Clostridia bacterium]|nr:NADH-quinone oxidoreductase subunit J [Clostridia bacterium]
MTIEEIKKIWQNAGIVGAGGAGFPSYGKLNTGADTLILNCAECEPLLKLHRQLLADKSVEIISAFSEIGKALGVKQCIIGIKSAYKSTLDAIAPIVRGYDNVTVKTLDEVYPAGDEVVLIYEVTGRVVAPGALPITQGVIVYNVETVYNAYRALHEEAPVIDKLVTVTCEVARPQTVRVPIGTAVQDVVAYCGGATVPDPVYVSGGAMMGRIVSGGDVITKTTNAILVLPADHRIVQQKRRNPALDARRAQSACCQCHMCSDLCPRHLLGHPIDPARFMRAVSNHSATDTEAYVQALYCSSCGLCESYSCMQGLSPRNLLAVAKQQLRKGGIKPQTLVPAPVASARNARSAPVERLAARLGLGKYMRIEAPLSGDMPATRVRVPLSMHIGAPSVPAVQVGDTVQKGQVIALPANGLSVALHAPIHGRVTAVGNEIIIAATQRSDTK